MNMDIQQPPLDGAAELQALIESEIPEGRQNLENSYANLERVAAYCEVNYLQAADKKAAFDETRRYTIQSLASVAYQVNTLAYSLMQMLDLQADKINDMGAQVNNIAQIVDIHKEKVARREIGILTSPKVVGRQHKIIAPVQQEKPQRYIRREIDYTVLDDIGHGVKLPSMAHPAHSAAATLLRTNSTVSGGSGGSGGHGHMQPQAMGTLRQSKIGSVSKGSNRDYRTAMAMSTPQAPQHVEYGTVQRQAQQPIYRIPQSGYAQPSQYGVYGQQAPAPIENAYGHIGQAQAPIMLPPPQLSSVADYRLDTSRDSNDELPPPPSPTALMGINQQHSPPLPPPPMNETESQMQQRYNANRNSRNQLPDWVPPNYVEKVIALYDYQADKADELTFAENSVIYVLRKNDDGWYEGVCNGVTGLFPAAQREAAAKGAIGRSGLNVSDPKAVTKEQWKSVLPANVYQVTQEAGTEPPFSGDMEKYSKFNSGCGWPAFHTAYDNTINRITDNSIEGYPRVEVRCMKCNAHLGHVFDDGPKPTGERYCINSVCMTFAPAEKK